MTGVTGVTGMIRVTGLTGVTGAQIAFTILLATSIGDRVTQCTAHERGVANAVKVGQNYFF